MQKVLINHAFLESGDQLLSNSVMSREYFPIWKIHFLIKILSLFQGNTLMIGDKYVRLFDNDLHIASGGFRGGVWGVPPLKFAKHMLYNVN